ncbi:MAG: metal-dependent transcriptional regulator [Thermoplasmatota archaeon]
MPRLSENVEMYLETIYRLTENGGKGRTRDIAHGWNVSPSSATEMVKRLAELGFVAHEPYHGVVLTKKGEEIGRDIVRKHRLFEVLLVREVGMTLGEASRYACEMEHVVPAEFERWVCSRLGHPRVSPGGEAIPMGACCAPEVRARPASAPRVQGRR